MQREQKQNNMKSFEEVYKVIKDELSENRLLHSEGVMQRCIEFAKLNNADVEKARLIGIAHDIAKEIPKVDRVRVAIENGIDLDEFEKAFEEYQESHNEIIQEEKVVVQAETNNKNSNEIIKIKNSIYTISIILIIISLLSIIIRKYRNK